MNRKLIIRILGAILCIEAAAMIPSLVISFIHRDGDTAALALSLAACAFLGCPMLCFVKTDKNVHLRLKEGFIITALGWILLSLFGALPFLFSGVLPRFEDAFFEAVSGFTITGASVVTEFEGFPRGVMFWRATTPVSVATSPMSAPDTSRLAGFADAGSGSGAGPEPSICATTSSRPSGMSPVVGRARLSVPL